MPAYTQAGRPMTLKTPLGPDALLLVSFAGHEGLSEPFRFEVEALAPRGAPVAFESLLGMEAHVEHRGEAGTRRHFHGLVSRIGELAADKTFIRYRLEIVPAFRLLALNVQNRIYQQQSVPQILQQVLRGLDVDYRLKGQYLPHNYCVQYQESDFHFASRLMEEEGIFYHFEHSEKGHQLVLGDWSADNPELAEPVARYDPEPESERGPRIQRWEKFQEVRPGRYTVWDRSFEMPGKQLEAKAESSVSVQAGRVAHDLGVGLRRQLEIFEYPAGYAHRFDGVGPTGQGQGEQLQKIFDENRRLAQVRQQEMAAEGLRIEGAGTCPGFTAGFRFRLEGHPHADGDYLLSRVEHAATLPDFRSDSTAPVRPYANRFVCLPRDLTYRPPRQTARPRMPGAQTATVVGAREHEVWTDKYGRVKVHFHWDRQGHNDGLDSCWVRVATNWAGKGYGLITLPRVGQEVVVDFLEGDPDQPLITGSVYNAEQVTPFDLPRNDTVTALRTQTIQGKRGDFHGLAFDDQQGSEKILLRSQKDIVVSAVNNHLHYVPSFHFTQVGGSQFSMVGGVVAPKTVAGEESENGDSGGDEGGGSDDSGGDDSGGDDSGGDDSGEEAWGFEVGVKLEPVPVGMAIATTYGVELGMVGGIKSYFDSIASVECVVDPFSAVLGLTGYAVPIPGRLSGLTGETKIVYGNVAELHYGPLAEVRRGPVFHSHHQSSTVTKLAAGIHGLSVLATIAMPGVLGAVKLSEETIRDTTAGCYAAATVLQWLVTQLELELDKAAAELDEAQEALEAATHALAQLNPNTANSFAQQITQRADAMATLVQLNDAKLAFQTNVVAGPYSLTARDIQVTAQIQAGSTGNFSLNAAGGLNLTSAGQLTAQSTGGNLVLRGQSVNMNCSAAGGSLWFYSGDNPLATMASIGLDSTMINLEFYPALAAVEISAAGVKLVCGGNSIAVTPTGIQLNGLQLTVEAVTNTVKATQVQVQV